MGKLCGILQENRKRRNFLTMQDWGYLKPKWKKEFSDLFVTANVHIIFTGRAGYTYDHITNEDGRTEISKSGIKMKTETETAYEPDVIVHMEREQNLLGKDKSIVRTATIIKDRSTKIDGKIFEQPTFKHFAPCVNSLLDGAISDKKTMEIPEDFEDLKSDSTKWMRKKEKNLETIKARFEQMGLGTAKGEKKAKIDILEQCFGHITWAGVESMTNEALELGICQLNDIKTKWLDYCNDCNETEQKVDLRIIYEILKSTKDETLEVIQAELPI